MIQEPKDNTPQNWCLSSSVQTVIIGEYFFLQIFVFMALHWYSIWYIFYKNSFVLSI